MDNNSDLGPESNGLDHSTSEAEINLDNIIPKSKAADGTLWPEYCNPNYKMPAVIEVKVNIGNENYFFPVSIVKANAHKPYFGGYRNKHNGLVYHHANTQTPSNAQKIAKDYGNLRSRETQTVETKTLSIQPYRESGTQMERIDLNINNKYDKLKYAKPYFTSDELLVKKITGAIVIQRYWRGYLSRCRAQNIRRRNIEFKQTIANEKKIDEQKLEEIKVKDMARRNHPKSNADFAVLYNELDAWRKAEFTKIKMTISDPEERKLAMAELLTNETKALQSLQQLKLAAQKEIHQEKTEQMLKEMSRPLQWQLSHGEVAFVHTPETQRAKQLLDLFNTLSAPVQSIDQRLEVILSVKWIVSENEIDISKEIKELVDREADLLNRNRPLASMERLRLRLQNLFLQYLQNPFVNPRSSEFIKEKM